MLFYYVSEHVEVPESHLFKFFHACFPVIISVVTWDERKAYCYSFGRYVVGKQVEVGK